MKKCVFLFLVFIVCSSRQQAQDDTVRTYINGELYLNGEPADQARDKTPLNMRFAPLVIFKKKKNADKNYVMYQGYGVSCVMKKGPGSSGEFIGIRNDSIFLKKTKRIKKDSVAVDTIGVDANMTYRIVSTCPESYTTSDEYRPYHHRIRYYHRYYYNNHKNIKDEVKTDLALAGIALTGIIMFEIIEDMALTKSIDMNSWEIVRMN